MNVQCMTKPVMSPGWSRLRMYCLESMKSVNGRLSTKKKYTAGKQVLNVHPSFQVTWVPFNKKRCPSQRRPCRGPPGEKWGKIVHHQRASSRIHNVRPERLSGPGGILGVLSGTSALGRHGCSGAVVKDEYKFQVASNRLFAQGAQVRCAGNFGNHTPYSPSVSC